MWPGRVLRVCLVSNQLLAHQFVVLHRQSARMVDKLISYQVGWYRWIGIYMWWKNLGSDSNVACNPGDDICPANYECVQSRYTPPPKRFDITCHFSTVPGFYMCCSEAARRASLPKPSKTFSSRAPKCPLGLPTNGQRCIVNGIGTCMDGYTCLGFGKNGICCKAQPKCPKMHRPYFIARKQVGWY